MKKEQFSDVLNMLNDDIIEETDRIRSRKKKYRIRWWKWGTIAACLLLTVYMGAWVFLQQSSDRLIDFSNDSTDLPFLSITDEGSTGMGFEGYMAYDISDLVNGNPWNETTKLSTLPVYQNQLSYKENHTISGTNLAKMREFLVEIAGRLGLDTTSLVIVDDVSGEEIKQNIIEKMDDDVWKVDFNVTKLISQTDGFKIQVDQTMTAEVFFEPAITLPEEYNFPHYATYEDITKLAKYIKDKYQGFIGMKEPQQNIFGGDYGTDFRQNYYIEFYNAGKDEVDQIINYNFNRIAFYCSNGKLLLVRIYQPDLSQKLGDYPIITMDKARELLLNGNYITSVPYKVPGMDNIKKVELIYRTGDREKYYMPYYRFYVELPEEVYEDNLKIYGAYYVPAVEGTYLSNMPIWDGSFN